MSNQFVPFAFGPSANVLTPAAYAGHTLREGGHVPGVALSELVNTTLRQTSTMTAALGKLIDDLTAADALDNGDPTDVAAKLLAMLRAVSAWQPGMIIMTFHSVVPNGWLLCNGQAVSRTTYADLYSVLSTNYGIGDGSTTFNLPDIRGEFLRVLDNGRGVDASRGLGTAQADMIKAHRHMVNEYAGVDGIGIGETRNLIPEPYEEDPRRASFFTADTGGSETRPRNIALVGLIKT